MRRWIGVALLAAGCGPGDPNTGSVSQGFHVFGEPAPDQGPVNDGGSSGGATCWTVTTRSALLAALAAKHQGYVCIPGDVEIDMTGTRDTRIYPGTKLWSSRGGTALGGRLFMDEVADPQCQTCEGDACEEYDCNISMFRVVGDDDPATNGETRIEGLRIHGLHGTHDKGPVSLSGIHIDTRTARDVVVTNNELSGFSFAGVRVTGSVDSRVVYPDDCVAPAPDYPCGTRMTADQAGEVLITSNYIHHNVRDSLGYGVKVGSGAYAYVRGNLFDYNRHAVSHDGKPFSGYIARYNYVLQGGHCQSTTGGCYYNQHFDVHGSAESGYGGVGGEYFEIVSNTIRGAQRYGYDFPLGEYVRPALFLRGEPTEMAALTDNVLAHDNADDAVKLDDGSPFGNMIDNYVDEPNRYGVDTTGDLAVGDFDGDGRDDVFIATGTAWFYSSAGKAEWRILRASTLSIGRLGFGDFDGDGRTDVLWRRVADGAWIYHPGGDGSAVQVNVSGVPFESYRFGDFNGDGLTDVFRTTGRDWRVSWGASSTWDVINVSIVGVEALRFADLDGDGATDVFNIRPDGQWRWSRSGQSAWMSLAGAPSGGNLAALAFGNFDGNDSDGIPENADRTDDIAQRDGDGWHYSKGGNTAWIALRGSGSQPGYADPQRCLVGDFDGNGRDDCLRYEQVISSSGWAPARFFWWWTKGSDPFVRYSRHPMR